MTWRRMIGSSPGAALFFVLVAAVTLAGCVPRERAQRLMSVDQVNDVVRRAREAAAGVCIYYYSNDVWLKLSQGLEERALATRRFREAAGAEYPVIVVSDEFRDVTIVELFMRDGSVETYFEPDSGVGPDYQRIAQNWGTGGCYSVEELHFQACERGLCSASAVSISVRDGVEQL